MGNNLTKEEVAKEIWGNIWNGDLNKISTLIDDYVPFSDHFRHPILHENAHQCGNDPNKEHITKEQKERFKRQDNLFKYLWLHPKFKFMLHNQDYTDTYEYTALERLRVEYRQYNEELKQFVRDNICRDIEDIKCIEKPFPKRGTFTFENTKHFGKLYSKEDVDMGEDTPKLDIDSVYGK